MKKKIIIIIILLTINDFNTGNKTGNLIPDDAVNRRKLGFEILIFRQQFKDSLEHFVCY